MKKINYLKNKKINKMINLNNEDKLKLYEENPKEKKLNELLINQNLYNNHKTKVISKDDYDFIVQLIKQEEDTQLINLINYLDQINIQIIKILINGFITFDFKDDKNILGIISKVIGIYFNKNLFYFIYKKLSKQYRSHDKIKDIEAVKKFEKTFKIWKILYDTKILAKNYNYNNNDISPIAFFPNNNDENKNIFINLKQTSKGENFYLINIYFLPSIILNLNKNNDKFSILKLEDDEGNKFDLKYNDLFKNNNINVESFSKVNRISISLSNSKYIIHINKDNFEKKVDFDFNSISKIEILNNFVGEISYITIEKDNLIIEKEDMKKTKLEIKIIKNIETGVVNYHIKQKNVKEENKNLVIEKDSILFNGEIFSDKYYYNNRSYKIWKTLNKNLNEIEYFGGFECIIPLFKLIKYIINELQKIFKNKNEEKKNDENLDTIKEYLDKSLEWIKDILKIIIKLAFLSENNYKNFRKIIIPLIGSLSEIYHILNKLSNNNNIFNKIKLQLFNDKIIYDLFIIINISKVTENIINTYQNVFAINLKDAKFSLDYAIFDINSNNKKFVDLLWHFLIYFNFIIFVLFFFNSIEKIPLNLINHLDSIYTSIENLPEKTDDEQYFIIGIKPFLLFVKNFFSKEKESFIKIFKKYHPFLLNENAFYFKYIINLIKIYLNVNSLLKINEINIEEICSMNSVKKLFNKLFCDKKSIIISDDKAINEIKNNFKNYCKDYEFLHQYFPFLKKEDFKSESQLLMFELIDYKGKYHHLMKELFIFNRLWSNQKIFYTNSLNERKKTKLKYKNINYYTRNFQRPIIYPVLDYKYRYPKFSSFKINKELYIIEETEDDYNFELNCSELEKILYNYNKNIFKKVQDNKEIKKYNICRIKQDYHIKGYLFAIQDNNKLLIYFLSNVYNSTNKKIPSCNKPNNDDLCYGALFKCHKKESNKKIIINFQNIRMILKRIYYYRQSGLEIFTETKSYFFNFFSEEDLNDFMKLFEIKCDNPSYFPITINNNLLGFIKLNQQFIKDIRFSKMKANFVDIIFNKIFNEKLNDICIFDIILLINLISNRTFIDLYQYPVFPLLFFYDKSNNAIPRDLNNHIGLQDVTEVSKKRKELFHKMLLEYEDIDEENKKKDLNIPYFFNTHYSNIVYIANYMIRLMPYSFCCIELQGEEFDDPNRLFHSIRETFYNISIQKSDLRELIPEFFYLPEMFMNINSFNFHKRVNGENEELVDDIIMPKVILQKNNNNSLINENKNIDEKSDNFLECFIFVDEMKNKLEKSKDNLGSWLNIIFGEEQKHKLIKVGKKKIKAQFFRSESYIDVDSEILKNYTNNELFMKSVDFGIIPLKTIFKKNLNFIKQRKNTYEKLDDKSDKELNNNLKQNGKEKKERNYTIKEKRKVNINNNKNNNTNYNILKTIKENCVYEFSDNNMNNYFYSRDNYKIKFEIVQNNIFEKLNIYINDKLKKEIIDHNDKIISIFYNPRLNMFGTTSYDGLACIYVFPNKLFSVIKHAKNSFFDKIYLSANPFPTIITYEKKNNIISSYSLSGLLIKEKKISEDNSEINIIPIFNVYGGASKDLIKVSFIAHKQANIYNIPFFDEYKK